MKLIIDEFLDKKEDFDKLSFTEQIKYLAYFYIKVTKDPIFTTRNINDLFDLAQINRPSNIPDLFNQLVKRKIFIKKKNGHVFHRTEFKSLDKEFSGNLPKKQVSKSLRNLVPKIKDSHKKKFLEEAIDCFEAKSYRAAIIMVWLLTMDNLYSYILSNKLRCFNVSLKKQNLKIKNIKDKDDFSELKESKFIEIARSAKIITNDVRKILDEKLGIRNSAAHPNDITFREAKAINFIEDLIENIFLKYNK